MTRSGSFRLGVTPAKAASKVLPAKCRSPWPRARGRLSSQARNWSSIFAAEAGRAEQCQQQEQQATRSAMKLAMRDEVAASLIIDGHPRRRCMSKRGPRLQRRGKRALVEIVEFAADRHAMRQPRHP